MCLIERLRSRDLAVEPNVSEIIFDCAECPLAYVVSSTGMVPVSGVGIRRRFMVTVTALGPVEMLEKGLCPKGKVIG